MSNKLKQLLLIFAFLFSLISVTSVYAVVANFQTDGGFTTQVTGTEYDCVPLQFTAASGATNMTLNFSGQIVVTTGRVLVLDNVTGEIMTNSSWNGGLINFNIPAANQVKGRSYIVLLVGYQAGYTRVFKAGGYPKTAGGIFIEGTASPANINNFTKESCQFTQYASGNGRGELFVEYNNISASDTVPPTANITFINGSTSILYNNTFNISVTLTDNTALSSAIIYTNASGSFGNNFSFVLSGTSAVISQNYTTLLTRGNVINITINVSDGTNVATNSTKFTIADTSPTFTLAINNTSPKINEVVQLSSLVFDSDTASTQIPSWNCTSSGAWTNLTNSTGNAIRFNMTANATIGRGRGNTCAFIIYSNDTVASFTASSISTFIVANTVPPASSITNSSDKNERVNATYNITSVADADSDIVNYIVRFESINPPTVIIYNGTLTNFTTNATNDTTYFIRVDTFDNFGTTTGTSIFNFTLDTSAPVQSPCNVANGSAYNSNVTITCTCTDTNLFEHNETSFRLSNGAIIFSNTTINLTPTYTAYTSGLNVNSTWGEGNYNISFWCGDTKNKALPIDYVNAGFDSVRQQFNDTRSGLQINLTFGIWLPNDAFYTINENDLIFGKTSSINNILKNGIVEHFETQYNVVLPNLFGLQIINALLSYTNIKFAIQVKSNQDIIQAFDNLNSHLEIGNGKNRLSFDAQDLIGNGFSNLSFRQSGSSYYLLIPPKNSSYTTGTNILIDPRIDNLNIIQSDATIIIDMTNPTFNSLNLSKNGFLGNNSFVSASILNFTYNVSDSLNNSILVYINNVKNMTSGYTSNVSQNASITFPDGNYTLLLEINDSAGNKINDSYLLGFVVDTKIPTSTNVFNRSSNGNITSITSDYGVNLQIQGLDDLYLSTPANWSENCTGTWVTHPFDIAGNLSSYTFTIGSANLTEGRVCGWKFNVSDFAGNLLDPIYTFTVGSPTPPAKGSGSSGSSGGSTSSIPLLSSGTTPLNDTCAVKQQLFDGRCYDCDPDIGYLEFNPDDRSLVCKGCQQGFILDKETKKCKLQASTQSPSLWSIYIDKAANYISQNIFNTTNPTLGYIFIFSSLFILIYYGYGWMKKP